MIAAKLSNVGVTLGGAEILQRIGGEVPCGEITILLGPNGAGKSTLLHVLAGTLATAGEVTLLDRPVKTWRLADLARHRAVLPQAHALQFPFAVEEVIALGSPTSLTEECIDTLLAEVDLAGFRGRLYPTLSGGEKQRVHMARVFAQLDSGARPFLLLLDEPTAALDLAHQDRMLQRLRARLTPEVAIVVVLHDLNLALRFADRALLLHQGKLEAKGPIAEVLTPERIAQVFALRAEILTSSDGSPVLHTRPLP